MIVTGIGYGIYNNSLLAVTVKSRSPSLTITNFSYDLTHYDFKGNEVYSGQFTLSKGVKIGPGKEKKITIDNVFGSSQAYSTVICITSVEYSDGTKWDIPKKARETETFTRK